MNVRDAILNATALPTEAVDVPEWGVTVHVRTLTAAERDAYQASLVKVKKDGSVERAPDNASGRLAALAISDERGNRLFTDDDAADLGRKSAKALARVTEAAARLSGLTDEAKEQARKN